jgi:hypothetical protein
MIRRLRIYFTGFAIGILIVIVMFWRDDSRDLDIWMPDQRVLEDIRNDSLFLAKDRLHCFRNCAQISEETLSKMWVDGKWRCLNPGGDPYRYLISYVIDDQHIEAEIEWDKISRKLIYLRDKANPKTCECD